jgi:hypothetical protein
VNNRWKAKVYVSPATNPSWAYSGIYGVEIILSAERSEEAIKRIVEEFARFGRNAEVYSIAKTEREFTIEDIEYLSSRFKADYLQE